MWPDGPGHLDQSAQQEPGRYGLDELHPDVVSRHLSCSVDHGICNDSSLAKGSTKGEPGEDVPGGRQHGWMRRLVGSWLG